MSKYSFERLGAKRFEDLSQSLLEKQFRTNGALNQFGDGPDGGREATWSQPSSHLNYTRPKNAVDDINKEWVFQVKFHDIGMRGWEGSREAIKTDLESELEKIVNKYGVPCHKYILITNVPFSGVWQLGTRDKINSVIKEWEEQIPEIEVWDAVDLSRMLDADPDTRTTFLNEILPGDVLQSFVKNLDYKNDRRKSAFHAYLKQVVKSERDAKAEEAGDESGLALEKIFVDLDLEPVSDTQDEEATFILEELVQTTTENNPNSFPWEEERGIPSSFTFLQADYRSILLKGGPGVGKSTITQFLTIFHAARLVDHDLGLQLAKRLKLPGGIPAEEFDAFCQLRFPIRIELRRYAHWLSDRRKKNGDTFLADYVAERIGNMSSSRLTIDDVFYLASTNPLLLILDGLDEVPHPDLREIIFNELSTFLSRIEGETCNIQLVLSTRPQGYRGEFQGFHPTVWQVMDLDSKDFESYSARWLEMRIPNTEERDDAQRRVEDGMQSDTVRQMASTLLQATVMLTIVQRKHPIPHARHQLFEKYVDVIFERERNKQTVHTFPDELKRLHELVGFELMRKMELAEGSQGLERNAFKSCVRSIIDDFGPKDLKGSSIGEVVEEIVTMAQNRLCLLAGKGDDQKDVDFVIQPFREYFAAAYLAHHEEGDPGLVFTSLVKRRNVWANVLKFYCAFQSIAQQNNWIAEADGQGFDDDDVGDIVKMTRQRRALASVLPEFRRPKNDWLIPGSGLI